MGRAIVVWRLFVQLKHTDISGCAQTGDGPLLFSLRNQGRPRTTSLLQLWRTIRRIVVIFWMDILHAFQSVFSQTVHETATYNCDDTRGRGMQFWPLDDDHLSSKHEEAWNILIVKQIFCVASCLITEINTLSCSTVNITSKPTYYNITLWVYRTQAVTWQFTMLERIFTLQLARDYRRFSYQSNLEISPAVSYIRR